MEKTTATPEPAVLDELTQLPDDEPRPLVRRGQPATLRSEVVEAFELAIAEGRSLGPDDLTTEELANLLGISRPTLIRMSNKDALPFRRTGGNGERRFRRSDALAYLHADFERRRRSLDELAANAEAFGYFEVMT